METKDKFKAVPVGAFRQIARADVEIKQDESGTAKFTVKALGGEIIDHWFFGPIIQDLSGMQMQSDRIPMDYNHGIDVIGFSELLSTEGGLFLDSTIVPFESDRGAEIVYKSSKGVPYQASIDYCPTKPDEILYEYIEDGQMTQVNGKEFQGPLTVVRKWILHGLAICPHGADSDTSVSARQSREQKNTMEVSVMENTDKKEVQKQEVKHVDSRAEFKKFVAEFGSEKAAEYFGKGFTFEQAEKQSAADTKAELEDLKKENELLKQSKSEMEKAAEELKAKKQSELDAHFSGVEGEKATFTRESIRAMTLEEYKQNRDAILKATNEGGVK